MPLFTFQSRRYLKKFSRSIAKTFYQLGVAHALGSKYEDSESSLNNAIHVLEKRIGNLSKMETSDNLASETSDLHSLVAEIKEKISDHKAVAEGKHKGSTTGFSGSTWFLDKYFTLLFPTIGSWDKPVSNIGIKKKVDSSSGKSSGSATVGCA